MVATLLTEILTEVVLPMLEMGLLALCGVLVFHLQSWLKAKGASEQVVLMTGRVGTMVESLVREANQTLVGDMKTRGEWDGETAIKVRQGVLEKAKQLLGSKAAERMGMAEPDLDALLLTEIEAAIDRGKHEMPMGKLAVVEAEPAPTVINVSLTPGSEVEAERLLKAIKSVVSGETSGETEASA